MNTVFSAIRSYSVVAMALFLLVSLTTSCKKIGGTDPDIDPRAQYVGTYEGGISSSLNVGGFEGVTQTGSATTVVTSAPNPRELYVEVNSSLGRPTPLKLTAELTDKGFTVIDRKTDQMNVLGKVVEGTFTAMGVLAGKELAITITTEGLSTGTAVKRNESVSGTKK